MVENIRNKNVSFAEVHIQATFNNTIVTFTDINGNTIASASAGRSYKGAKKSTPYAAQIAVEAASAEAKNKGVKTVILKVKGAGIQRESAMMAVLNQKFIVKSIADVSPVPHNGCRAPKRRRG